MSFDRYEMMAKIADTLKEGESIEIRVSNARGKYTLIHKYSVTRQSQEYTGHSWGGHGNLRELYRRFCK